MGTQRAGKQQFHCVCVLDNDSEVVIKVKAKNATEACERVHKGYSSVAYILEQLDPEQAKKRRNRFIR